MSKTGPLMAICSACAFWAAIPLLGDQVVMQNGDKYLGKVLYLSADTLKLQNENLGSITLPRSKITAIIFGTGVVPASLAVSPTPSLQVRRPVASNTNSAGSISDALRSIRSQTNLIQQVQSQLLGGAGPAATDKFNELLDGLSTGKIDMNALRAEAQSAADQLRSLKTDSGQDPTGELDSYLAILNNFLQETAPTNAAKAQGVVAPDPKSTTAQTAP